jgi:2-polyprenyl-3-methyl-5-hydroxy-6-metoxy-1,4-benzoquinol methylase
VDRSTLGDKALTRRRREELFDPGTVGVLERLGVGPGWRCLEVGAGLGSIALWLARRRVQPLGKVVATDVREEYLDVLHTLDEPGLEVMRHDVVTDTLPGGEYDLVHSRFVIEHLSEREAVVGKLAFTLRPGGWLVVEDADFSACLADPNRPYARAMRAFVQAMAVSGTDYDWTRQLPQALQASGLTRVEATGSVTYFQGGSIQAQFWAANWLDMEERFTAASLLTVGELEQALRVIADPSRWFIPPMVVSAIGVKPR